MSVAAETSAKLDINRVIRRGLDVVLRNWRSLVRPALLYLYLPGVVVGFLKPHTAPVGMQAATSPLLPLASLGALIFYALFEGGLIRLTVADLRAEPISTDDAMRVGRERMWAMFGLSILAGLAIGLGFLLLVVPGVIAAIVWSVVAPVLIEERRPVLQTFGRSAELTRGSRLNILGVGLILLALELVAAIAAGLVSAPFPRVLGDLLIWPLVSAVSGIVGGVAVAVVYDELRGLREDAASSSPVAS
jgi:hypothetical protein